MATTQKTEIDVTIWLLIFRTVYAHLKNHGASSVHEVTEVLNRWVKQNEADNPHWSQDGHPYRKLVERFTWTEVVDILVEGEDMKFFKYEGRISRWVTGNVEPGEDPPKKLVKAVHCWCPFFPCEHNK